MVWVLVGCGACTAGNIGGDDDGAPTAADAGSRTDAEPLLTDAILTPADFASDILNLRRWKLTLPIDSSGGDSSDRDGYSDRNNNAHEVVDLVDYDMLEEFATDEYFKPSGDHVQFHAHCAGATTNGSGYPRSELRQRVGDGDNYWSVDDYQFLRVIGHVSAMPDIKPEVHLAQIHGGENEPLKIKYVHAERKLFIIYNEDDDGERTAEITYDYDYTDGAEYDITIIVDDGYCDVYFDRDQSSEKHFGFVIEYDDSGYFKAGVYTQSSIFLTDPDWKDMDEACSASRAGEVQLRHLELVETYEGSETSFE